MKDQHLTDQIVDTLGDRESRLDERTLRRLYRARAEAVCQAGPQRPRGAAAGWLHTAAAGLMGAVASLLLVVMIVTIVRHPVETETSGVSEWPGGMASALLTPDSIDVDLELLEHIEFYHWLELVAAETSS